MVGGHLVKNNKCFRGQSGRVPKGMKSAKKRPVSVSESQLTLLRTGGQPLREEKKRIPPSRFRVGITPSKW